MKKLQKSLHVPEFFPLIEARIDWQASSTTGIFIFSCYFIKFNHVGHISGKVNWNNCFSFFIYFFFN